MTVSRKTKWTYLAFCILTIVLGLCLILWPQISARTLCWLFGLGTAALGVAKIVCYFRRDVFGIPLYADLALGLLDLLFGILLIARPEALMELVPTLVGIVIVVNSMFKFQTAADLHRTGLSGWLVMLLLAVLSVVLGVLLIFRPFAGASALMIFIGVSLVTCGIENLYAGIYVSRHLKDDIHVDTFYFM